jgi:Cu2+-exporting ATPase
LARAAALAAVSRHPYARAVARAAATAGLSVAAVKNVVEVAGFGLEASGPHGVERLGSAEWCGANSVNGTGSTIWYRAPDGRVTALHFEDRLRPDAADVVRRMRAAGLHVELLSGDREAVVSHAAREAGIGTWRASTLPAEKIARIEELKVAGRRVLMIGDGLNDAPALAAGHASLSPSNAADIAQTAADAVLQGERLEPVLETLAVARAARRMALQNFAIAIGYNCVFVPLAIVGHVTPLLAAIAMSASSIAVTANAIRLGSKRLGRVS